MKQLPKAPAGANERVLAQEYREELTGVTGSTLTLTHQPLRTVNGLGLELLFKNGTLLTPGVGYTIDGQAVTLAVAAVSGDVFVARYPYNS